MMRNSRSSSLFFTTMRPARWRRGGLTGPLARNGQDEALPDGIDQAIEQIFTQHRSHEPISALCALTAEISPDARET